MQFISKCLIDGLFTIINHQSGRKSSAVSQSNYCIHSIFYFRVERLREKKELYTCSSLSGKPEYATRRMLSSPHPRHTRSASTLPASDYPLVQTFAKLRTESKVHKTLLNKLSKPLQLTRSPLRPINNTEHQTFLEEK